METIYEFTAYNSECIYGFGTESEAHAYLAWLNRAREINQYEMNQSTLSMEQGETLAINLRDNLNDLDWDDEDWDDEDWDDEDND